MKKVIIYSGRFQPMLKHHAEVYNGLRRDHPDAEVYVSTSNKTNQTDSPFNFQEKQKIISAHGIPADKVIAVTMPYNQDEYTQYFDPQNTILIFAVGEKDIARFPFSNTDPRTGLDMYLKDATKAKFHQPYSVLAADPQPMATRGYIMYVKNVENETGDIASASKFRSAIADAPDEQSAKDIVTKQFGRFDQEVFDLIYNRIKGTKMKENIEILKKLAGIVEAPVKMPDFEKGERPKTPKEREAYRAWRATKAGGADPKIVAAAADDGVTDWPKEREAYRAWKAAKDSGADPEIVAATGDAWMASLRTTPIMPSAKDARLAAARPAQAAASDPVSATFTKIKPEDMKQDGQSIPSKQRKQSIANRFPADTDINDPEAKKQMFLRVAARSPYMLFSEINARLGSDDNSLAVSDRLSDIVAQFAEGATLMQLSPEDKTFALKVLGNAIDNMELVKASEVDRVFDEPEDAEGDDELKDSVDLNDIRADYSVDEITEPSSDLAEESAYADLDHQGVSDQAVKETATNAMEAALAELRKLAGI